MTSDGTSPSERDEDAVRNLLRRMVDGWNQGSGEGFAAPFAEDGDQVAFDGTRFRGRQQIAEFHLTLFDRCLRGSGLVGTVTEIRCLTADIALAHAIGGTVMPGAIDLAPDRNSMQTLVATRQGGVWRLASFHNSRAEFVGQPGAAAALTEEPRQLL